MSSAIWGAVKGLGTGMADVAQQGIKQDDELQQIDYRAMKEEALAKVRGGIDAANTAASNTQQADARIAQIGKEGEVNAANEASKDERAATQKDLDRKNELEIQRLRNQGAVDAAGARTSTHRKVTNRFTFKTADGGEATNWAQVTRLEDAGSNRVYELNGDRFNVVGFKEDPAKPTPAPNQKAYDELNKAVASGDEATINSFGDQFHFVPAYAIRALPKFMTGPDTGTDETATSSGSLD